MYFFDNLNEIIMKRSVDSILDDLKYLRDDMPAFVQKWWGTSIWSMFQKTRVSYLPTDILNTVIQTISDDASKSDASRELVQVLERLTKRYRRVNSNKILNNMLSDKTSVFHLYYQLLSRANENKNIPLLLNVLHSTFFVKELKTGEELKYATSTRDVYRHGDRYNDDWYEQVEFEYPYYKVTNYRRHNVFFAELAKLKLEEIAKTIEDNDRKKEISNAIVEFEKSKPKDKILSSYERESDEF